MNTIGSMKSFAADTQIAPKTTKASGGHFGLDDDASQSGFDALMAGLIAPSPAPVAQEQPTATDTNKETDSVSSLVQDSAPMDVANQVIVPQVAAASDTANATSEAISVQATANALEATNTQLASTQAQAASTQTQAESALAIQTSGDQQAASDALSAQLALLSEGQTVPETVSNLDLGTPQIAAVDVPASTPSATPKTNTQIPSAAQPAAVDTSATQQQTQSGQDTGTQSAAPATTPTPAEANNAPKSKAVDVDAGSKLVAAKTVDAINRANDGSASGTTSTPSETTMPTGEAAKSAPQLTPHTIPMLAATMMRRLESGAKQFSMRLDPPELGQVEVKLTVDADKKVRAVISADRPEALADLVRSARELTRALHDAGLDLEDNGLTFTLNDPAGDQGKNQQGSAHARGDSKKSYPTLVGDTLETETKAATTHKPTDPFQSWQRARIALTA
jgi:flagellar hook-length control protein FliK